MNGEYQINVRRISHRQRYRRLLFAFILLVILGVIGFFIARHFIHDDTKLHQGKSLTTNYSATSTSNLKTYKASDFSFQMSAGWTGVPVSNSLYHIYEWQTGKGANYQTIQIFQDTIPTNFAVNKVILVQADVSRLTALGSPSANCSTFTNGHMTNTQVGYPAKWQGAPFNCNLNNTLLDTVGTTTVGQINTVNLVSPTDVHHSYFFLYTDSTLQPNYDDYLSLLNTFQLQ